LQNAGALETFLQALAAECTGSWASLIRVMALKACATSQSFCLIWKIWMLISQCMKTCGDML